MKGAGDCRFPEPVFFTDKFIASLKADTVVYQVRDASAPGFGARVHPSGVKTWFFIYTLADKRRQMNLGKYPAITLAKAKVRLVDASKALHDGKDPQDVGFEWHRNPERERREAARKAAEEHRNPTIKTLAADYIKLYAKGAKRSWEADQAFLDREVLPVWGKQKAKDITRRDVKKLLRDLIDRPAPVTANRVLSLVKKLFNFAIDEEILDTSPCARLKPLHSEQPKERALSDDEIRTMWGNLDKEDVIMSDELKRALKLILVTAQRPGEVIGIHTREIDGHWWTIPAARAKNNRTHRVYLSKMALELMGDLEGKGFVFPSPKKGESGEESPIDVMALSRALRRNLVGQGVRTDKVKRRKGEAYKRKPYKLKPLPADPNRLEVAPFTPHDLRRTATTLMSQSKIPLEHRQRVLNHSQGRLDKTYNLHDYDHEKQTAMETLERKILSITTGTPAGKVVPITSAAG